jgi:hypothetical protein
MSDDGVGRVLGVLCDQNRARGAVFRAVGDDLSLVSTTARIDQAFLDAARVLWAASSTAEARSDGLYLFHLPSGVVCLDRLDDGCTRQARDLLLGAIGQKLAKLERKAPDLEAVSAFEFVSEDELKRQRLAAIFRRCGWNVTELARREGVSRRTMHSRLNALGIRRPTRS